MGREMTCRQLPVYELNRKKPSVPASRTSPVCCAGTGTPCLARRCIVYTLCNKLPTSTANPGVALYAEKGRNNTHPPILCLPTDFCQLLWCGMWLIPEEIRRSNAYLLVPASIPSPAQCSSISATVSSLSVTAALLSQALAPLDRPPGQLATPAGLLEIPPAHFHHTSYTQFDLALLRYIPV